MAELKTSIILKAKDQATQAIQNVSNSVKRLNKSIEDNRQQIKDFTTASAAVAVAIGAVGAKSISAASDLEELQSKARELYKKDFVEVQKRTNDIAKEVGRAGSDILQFSTDMAAVLEPAGLINSEFQSMSTNLAKLAVDLASFHNKSDAEAFNALRSGIVGETEPLKRLGIVMTQTNLAAFALSQGIRKNIQEFTQAELATLRYNFLMNSTKTAQGDAARTAGSVANQLRRLQGNVKTLFEILGKPILSITSKFLISVNKGLNLFNKILDSVNPVILTIIASVVGLTGAIAALSTGVGLFLLALPKLTASLATVSVGFKVLQGTIIKTKLLLAEFYLPIAAVIAILGSLYLFLTKTATGNKILSASIGFVKSAFKLLSNTVGDVVKFFKVLFNIGSDIGRFLKDKFSLAVETVKNKFKIAIESISDFGDSLSKKSRSIKSEHVPVIELLVESISKIPLFAKAADKSLKVLGDAGKSLSRDLVPAINNVYSAIGYQYERVDRTFKKTDSSARKLSDSFKDLFTATSSSSGSPSIDIDTEKLDSDIQDIKDAYVEMRTKVRSEITKLDYDHVEKLTSIRDQMGKVKTSLIELDEQYKRSMQSISERVGDAFVQNSDRIKELKERIEELQQQSNKESRDGIVSESTIKSIAQAEQELRKLKDAQDRVIADGFYKKYSDSIKESFRRSELTNLERAIEDAGASEKELKEQTEKRREELERENEQLIKQANIAKETYAVQRTELELTRIQVQQFHDNYIANLENIDNTTGKTVKSLQEKLKVLQETIAAIDALLQSKSHITGGTSITSKVRQNRTGFTPINVPKFATGGIVNSSTGGTLVNVGEGGQNEAIVPLPNGRSIPVEINNGTRPINVVVNLGGITVTKSADEDRLVAKITRAIQLQKLQSL